MTARPFATSDFASKAIFGALLNGEPSWAAEKRPQKYSPVILYVVIDRRRLDRCPLQSISQASHSLSIGPPAVANHEGPREEFHCIAEASATYLGIMHGRRGPPAKGWYVLSVDRYDL